MRRKYRLGSVMLVPIAVMLFLSSVASSEGSSPDRPLEVKALLWEQAAFTGQADPTVLLGGRVSVDGPIALGRQGRKPRQAPWRLFVNLDITAQPGVAFNLARPETFGRAAELTLGAYRVVGERAVGGETVTTATYAEWGFATTLQDQPLERYVRHYAVGVRLAEETSGAQLWLGYGRHEAGGSWGWGQWQVRGEVPLAFTGDVVRFGGEAILSVGRVRPRSYQRDVLRLHAAVDAGRAGAALVGIFKRAWTAILPQCRPVGLMGRSLL